MKIHENKTLHRIVDTIARSKSMDGIIPDQCLIILSIASLDRPIKSEILHKSKSTASIFQRHLLNLIKDGYVKEDGTKRALNHRDYEAYALTKLGEYTCSKLLGIN